MLVEPLRHQVRQSPPSLPLALSTPSRTLVPRRLIRDVVRHLIRLENLPLQLNVSKSYKIQKKQCTVPPHFQHLLRLTRIDRVGAHSNQNNLTFHINSLAFACTSRFHLRICSQFCRGNYIRRRCRLRSFRPLITSFGAKYHKKNWENDSLRNTESYRDLEAPATTVITLSLPHESPLVII